MKELDYEGEILYDYQNSFDYHVMDIRDNIVYLSQNDKIFNDTIKNNILFGLEDDNERLKKIIKITKLDDVIKKRGMRIESSIDEESLSGGEKNRILLARTIYSKRNVYILDEPLREVGLNLEIDIIKDILEFLKDKVVIYISHRDVSKLFERIIDLDEI
jgi:ABC-type bacteriocin/lantibiotic exporter with double-glycine peptidase domain